MFEGILHRAQSTIDAVLAKYLGRVLVAVPLLVAVGFATAAVTVKMSELYGVVTGLAIMAGAFVVLALLTLLAVAPWSNAAATASAESSEEESATEQPSPQAEGQMESLLTPELKTLLGSAAPTALPVLGRLVMRSLPAIVLLAMVVYVFSRFSGERASASEAGPTPEPGTTPEEDQTVGAPSAEESEAA